jgi:hypothetical protein
MLREAQNIPCFASLSRIWKSKRPIQTIEHDLHIEISLEIKLYIFLKLLLFYRWVENH